MAKPLSEILGDKTPDQLLALPTNQLALRLRRPPTRLLTKLDNLSDARFKGKYKPNPRYSGHCANVVANRDYDLSQDGFFL